MEQIQKETKIRTKYLTAIENGDFSVIPGGDVYVKGFLKNYADTIGLDSSVVIELYKKVTGKENENENDETDSTASLTQDSAKVDDLSGKPKHKIVSIAVLLVIFLILAVTFIKAFKPKHSQHETKPPMSQSLPEDETNKPDVEDTTHSIEDLNDVEDTKDAEVIVEVTEDSKQQTVYVVDDDFVEVTMNVTDGRCWISVIKDGIADFEGTLNTGETKTWRAEKDISIRIGNPPVINLVINGKDFGRPTGETRNFIFKRRT